MDEKPNEIMNHIESQRHQLGRNLDELEARVKRTADWRAQFDRNPMLMIGVALGGGVLLESIVNGAVRRNSHISSTSTSESDLSTGASYGYDDSVRSTSGSTTSSAAVNSAISPARGEVKGKVTDTLEQIKGALIAFATAKVKDFMAEALPGFGEHLEHAERQHLAGRGTARDYSGQYSSGDFQRPGSSGSQSSGTGSQRTEYSSQTPYRQ
jgi:hypothetical protein